LDVSTVSRHVKQLEDAGLLTRTEDPGDGRVSRLNITPQGRALLEEAMGARAAAIEEGMAGWSERDRATLTTLLTRLANSLSRPPVIAATTATESR
jgi:DNA-binding MarR family transcriptional regulator